MKAKSKRKTAVKVPKNLQRLSCVASSVKSGSDGLYIEGFANKPVIDRGKEVMEPNCWKLDNYKKNPVILYNHGMDSELGGTPIGKAVMVEPRKEGLFLRAKITNANDKKINLIRSLIDEGMLKAFSVGFDPKDSERDADGVTHIKSAELYEVSVVGIPMNQDSLFSITGKMLATKSLDQIGEEICSKKGARVAAAIHARLAKLQSNENFDRDKLLGKIGKLSDMDMDKIKEILSGDLTPIPEEALEAFATILGIDEAKLIEFNRADMGDNNNEEGEQTNEGDESQEGQEEGGEENTESEESNEGADSESDRMAEAEDQETGEESENEDDKATDEGGDGEQSNEDGDDSDKSGKEDGSDDDEMTEEEKKQKDFQECVNEKIPTLIDEGMEQDQAVAVAISMCEGKNCRKPSKEMYQAWFKLADDYTESKKSNKNKKQADQDKVDQTTSTVAAANSESDDNDTGSPQLDMMKQTNVLLGALISEIQGLSAKIESMMNKPEETDQTTDDQTQNSGMDENESNDENEKGLDSKKEIFDLLNLKYPLSSTEECNEARIRLKKFGSRVCKDQEELNAIYAEVVEAQLSHGENPVIDENDLLDKSLSNDLKVKIANATNVKNEKETIDLYKQRLENLSKRLKSLGM